MKRTETRKKVLKEATRRLEDNTMKRILEATGMKADETATRTFRAMAEEAMVEFATRAAETATERNAKTLNAECVACGATRTAFRTELAR